MSTNIYRFHVTIGEKKRSTVSFPKYLLTMFSLKQGWNLDNQKDLHQRIRVWCNETLKEWNYDEHAINYSQFLQEKMVESIMDKKLSSLYDDLFKDDFYSRIRF